MLLLFQYCTSHILRNNYNNQQFNVKAVLQKKKKKKDSNLCQNWSDLIYIYKFDNALTFKLKSTALFCGILIAF